MKKTQANFPVQTRLGVLLMALAAPVLAQTAPNIDDALRQTRPPTLPAAPEPALPKLVEPAIEAPMAATPAGPKILVKKIGIEGNKAFDTASLIALVQDAEGQSLTLAELEKLARRITRHYRLAGYFVARAYIPAQDVTDGMVKIRVIEGNYGQFSLKNSSLVRDEVVQGMLDAVKGDDIVSVDTLERAMLIINDTPGVQVIRADVMPGAQVGASDFAVETAATAPYAGYVVLDNFGSRYTGRNRLSANLDVNSPSGRGDRFSVGGLVSNGGDLLDGRLAYLLPLTATGLTGELAYSHVRYELGSRFASLQAHGTADAVDATLAYPLRRTQKQTLRASLDVSYKNLKDWIDTTGTATPKTAYSATAGLDLRDESRLLGANGVTQAGLQVTAGHLDINDPAALALDQAGPRTQGRYAKLGLSFSRLSLLPADFTLLVSARHQRALDGKNLTGSEQLAVTGADGVMAYAPGELVGTNATLARVEFSHPLPLIHGLASQALLFGDWGRAWEQNPLPTQSARSLADVGLGWKASWKQAIVNAYWVHRTTGVAVSEPTGRNRFLLQAGWLF